MQKNHFHDVFPIVLLLALFSAASVRSSVIVTNLHSFGVYPGGVQPHGAFLQASDGNFYGITSGFQDVDSVENSDPPNYGYGTVFRMTPAGALSTLYYFSFADGAYPQDALIQDAGGVLYGTTAGGGLYSQGTVFKITTNGALTTLHQFSGADGAYPNGGLAQGLDGNFYGATYLGGTNGDGTIFVMSDSGAFSNLYCFGSVTNADFVPMDGEFPDGVTLGQDGNFYGVTEYGGTTNSEPGIDDTSDGSGTIFRVTPAGVLTTIYTLTNGTDGFTPFGTLCAGKDGNFYGETRFGGTNAQTGINGNAGTVFQITPAGVLTRIYAFTGVDGPIGGVVQGQDGDFYFPGSYGPHGQGDVLRLTPGGELSLVYAFTTNTGGSPCNPLVQGTDGALYGANSVSPSYNIVPFSTGAIYKVTTNGGFTNLYAFPSPTDVGGPNSPLTLGPDGYYYGTTTAFESIYGDIGGNGSIYKISTNGVATTVYVFTNGADSAGPGPGGLTLGSDGNFYGAAESGNVRSNGIIFIFSTNGQFHIVHVFDGTDGAYPTGGLIETSPGLFYGTTLEGGTNHDGGTFFAVTSSGLFTNLYNFDGQFETTGWYPQSVTLGPDGNFYGVTFHGGPEEDGTVFKITPSGSFSNLYTFYYENNEGAGPYGPLLLGQDGNFYGTTSFGGTNYDYGTVFKMTPSGALTTLYYFTGGSDGGRPQNVNLTQASNGDIYGVTPQGTGCAGTIFKVTTNGAFYTIYDFPADYYYGPYGPLVQAANGVFYGTTFLGGLGPMGTFFRMTVTPTGPPVFTSATQAGASINLTWTSDPGAVYQLESAPDLTATHWNALGSPVTANGTATSANDLLNQTAKFYRVQLLQPSP